MLSSSVERFSRLKFQDFYFLSARRAFARRAAARDRAARLLAATDLVRRRVALWTDLRTDLAFWL